MQAVRLYDAGDLRFEEIDAPAPPPAGFANLSVSAAGICGSDLHNYRTGQWITRRPSVAGHEFCGVVTAVGEGVTEVRPGDTVVADSRYWCGECRQCRDGYHNACEKLGFVGELCDGGFAEAVQLPVRLLHHYPATLSAKIAAMAEPLAVALHAVRKLDVPEGQPVVIVGCGTIGGLAALLLAGLHDGPILVCDRNADRAEAVAKLADAQVVSLDKDAVSAAVDGAAVRFALDATGNVQAITSTLSLLDGGGRLALVGIGHGTFPLDPTVLVEREISLVGCHAFIDELPEAITLLSELQPKLVQLMDTISLADVPAAYDRLLAGSGTSLKTIIAISNQD